MERDDAIKACTLAVAAGEHVLLLGPPGTGKTELIEAFVRRFRQEPGAPGFFGYTMTRETTQSELFGAYDYGAFKANGTMRRNTTNKAPAARWWFLDEIFKANSSCLNSLLRALNNREFDDGTGAPVKIPLDTMFAASNELPESDALDAMYDRILVREVVNEIQSSAEVAKLLGAALYFAGPKRAEWFGCPEHKKFPTEALGAVREQVAKVEVYSDVLRRYIDLLDQIKAKVGVSVSDRRKVKTLGLIRANAWIEGRTRAQVSDLSVLRYTAWNTVEDRGKLIAFLNAVNLDPAASVRNEHSQAIATLDGALAKQRGGKVVAAAEINKKIQESLSRIQTSFAAATDPAAKAEISRLMDEIRGKLGEFQSEALAGSPGVAAGLGMTKAARRGVNAALGAQVMPSDPNDPNGGGP
jgi:MoxR-like ATPase